MYPKVEVDLSNIKFNAERIVSLTKRKGINVWGVTKGVSADLKVAKTMLEAGVSGLADSRIENLKRLSTLDTELMLLRSPMISQVSEVVEYADISLNSELEVVNRLNQIAKNKDKLHKIILMIDLGDRREGILPKSLFSTVKEIIKLDNIKLIGIGTNLACFMGVLPTRNKMEELIDINNSLEKKLNLKLPIISGGNSSSLPLLLKQNYQSFVNQLRVGETILLGKEVPSGDPFSGTRIDTFKLKAEIIELKEKPTSITGKQGENAFGKKKEMIDKGVRARAILAVGKQDIDPQGLTCCNNNVQIEGASSDHLIIDVTEVDRDIAVGDKLVFRMNYACLLKTMTSPYVDIDYIEGD